MLTQWRRQWNGSRVEPGDGRALAPYRWWQTFLGRALLHLDQVDADRRPVRWSVDVRHQGDSEGRIVAHLFRDGRHVGTSRVPVGLPVPGGTIEVATSAAGLKRCEFVAVDGTRRRLVPDPRSPEGRRARLERDRPALSRGIGLTSVVALVVGVGLNLVQILDSVSRIPPVAAAVGVLESPVHLPIWLNVALGVLAALATTERALRMRHHWLLDGAGS